MISQALNRLLTDRAYRAAFLEGRHEELGLSEDVLQDLSTIDPHQLQQAADKVRDSLLRRQYRGSGGLPVLYQETLGERDLKEIVSRFLESEFYDSYREIDHGGVGLCLEEAFYRFCEAEEIGDPTIREREFLVAMAKALLFSGRPSFRIPKEIRPVPGGYVGLTRRGKTPRLCASLNGKFVTGALTPFLGDLLCPGVSLEEVAERHRVPASALAASVVKLQQMGLLY
jgi:hypothetical protein